MPDSPDMTDTLAAAASSSSSSPGRWIRAALVLLPAGTVLLGIASFGIWQWKKDRAADQSFRYATALKREITTHAVEKHAGVLRGVINQPDVLLSVPGYLKSTMGEENMGYTVRSDRFESGGGECVNVDAELSGGKRPHEVVLVLVPYSAQEAAAAGTLATMLVLAHELTGQGVDRTLRFAALPRVEGALERMAAKLQSAGDRVMRLHVLGTVPEKLEEVWKTKAAGTVIESLALPPTVAGQATLAKELKEQLLREAALP